jgi:hypothetical protein
VAGDFEQNSKHARAEGSGKLSNTSGTTFSLNFEGSNLANSPSHMQQNPQAFFSHVKERKHHAQRNSKLNGLLPQKLVLEPRILCCFWNRFQLRRNRTAFLSNNNALASPLVNWLLDLSAFFVSLRKQFGFGATETIASAKRPRDEPAAASIILGQARLLS